MEINLELNEITEIFSMLMDIKDMNEIQTNIFKKLDKILSTT